MADIGTNLKRYSDLDDVEIAKDDPDVRGWDVVAPDGRELGEVKDLIVDTSVMKVRYLDTELDHDAFGLKDDREVLVPVEAAQLDRDEDQVVLDRISWQELGKFPAYTGQPIGPDYWRGISGAPADVGRQPERSAAAKAERSAEAARQAERPAVGGEGRRLTRAEEELRIGKRATQTGEVVVGKHVETEHVNQPVTRKRERVNVERRPATGREGEAAIGSAQDEIRMPIVEEEVVVEKRPVVKEELVVNRDTVEETQNVQADVRKERFDVEREGDVEVDKGDVPERERGGR